MTRRTAPSAVLLAALLLGGCASQHLSDDVPDIVRGYRPHMQQVLNNIALFTKDPGAWPSHVLIYKGTFETRRAPSAPPPSWRTPPTG